MKTKYDWSVVPSWVNWIAMDSTFEIFGFEDVPIAFDDYSWCSNVFVELDLHTPNCNWKDSLEERPK